jgi:nonspecific dipeptidase
MPYASLAEAQTALHAEIDAQKEASIKHLADWVAVKCVSTWLSHRDYVHEMLEIGKKEYEELGAECKIVKNPVGKQIGPDGDEVDYPGIILGKYPKQFDPAKKTILIYGHLDVQPAMVSDGWNTDPWVLTQVGDKLYGRGSTDDKGPVLGWLIALKAMKKLGIELPVNLKFCLEGMEESGSVGLKELIFESEHKDFFYPGVDGTIISDNYWIGTEKPCLTYGLRGIAIFQVTAECADKDLHSGLFGGTVHEAMTDMIKILGSLVDNKGKILIDGIYDQVTELTDEEAAMYDDIDFDADKFAADIKGHLMHEGKQITLQNRWRNPCCSIHGIEGAFYEPGEKTVIPKKVIGKFSIRTVPDMTAEAVIDCVKAHIEKQIKLLNSPNKIFLNSARAGVPWYGNPKGYLFEAAIKATERVYGCKPDMTREGGSIPVTIDFEQATKAPVILIPMGCGDDGAHSQNEKINIRNFIEGTKLLGSSLLELDGKKE